jgi:PAS domain S-box-containing protein
LGNQNTLLDWQQLFAESTTGYMVFRRSGTNALSEQESTCVYSNTSAEVFTGFNPDLGHSFMKFFGNEDHLVGKQVFFPESGRSCAVSASLLSDEFLLYSVTESRENPDSNLMVTFSDHLWKEAEKTMQFGGWIWCTDKDTIEWSEGMARLMGYEPGELPIQTLTADFWIRHIHPDDRDGFKKQLDAIPTFVDSYILEFRVLDFSGQVKNLYLKGENISDQNGKGIIAMGTAFDISVLKKMQGELVSKVNDLNKSNADLEQFAYVASHDLQEPLRKIASFGERLGLKAGSNLNEEQHLYLDRMLNATRRMQEMVKNLLEFSRIAGTARVYTPTDLNVVVQNAMGDLELVISQKGAIIESDNLPTIDAIPSQMSQLFVNLISNSLKFVKEDTIPRITIRCVGISPDSGTDGTQHAEMVKLVFQDNGIGFGNESSEKIFTIFQRLRGRSEYEGSGIGLSVCKKVVEMHDGTIEAFGVSGDGARFDVCLPVYQNTKA